MASANTHSESNSNVPADVDDAGPQHVSLLFSVLDLPQLYSKPSAQSLLSTLALLAVVPSSWTARNANEARPVSISEDGVPSYLTRIISSPLAWIPPDTDKEQVWEAASARLAERSGRTAMPSVSRTFKIPTHPPAPSSPRTTIDITLHEPSLTGDNLGHKTWLASYLLAKRLPTLLPRLFPSIRPSSSSSSSSSPHRDANLDLAAPRSTHPNKTSNNNNPPPRTLRILELGAGTGLVGLAASALFATTTHLTDLPAILPNLTHNIAANASLLSSSTVTAAPLDWSDPHPLRTLLSSSRDDNDDGRTTSHPSRDDDDDDDDGQTTFHLILAADSLYAPEHPAWLVRAMAARLERKDGGARAVVELPFRSAEPPEHEELRGRMRGAGFVVVEEGWEVGFEDWEDLRAGGGRLEVRCWWCVWRWG